MAKVVAVATSELSCVAQCATHDNRAGNPQPCYAFWKQSSVRLPLKAQQPSMGRLNDQLNALQSQGSTSTPLTWRPATQPPANSPWIALRENFRLLHDVFNSCSGCWWSRRRRGSPPPPLPLLPPHRRGCAPSKLPNCAARHLYQGTLCGAAAGAAGRRQPPAGAAAALRRQGL